METNHHKHFSDIFTRMERLDFQHAPLKQLNLSLPQVALLRCIARNPGSHAQEVAEAIGLTAPTVSVGLRRLEEEGWLRREPDPEDGRAMLHFLTDKSLQVMNAIRQFRNQKITEFLRGLSEAEQDQLIALMDKALGHLETQQGK